MALNTIRFDDSAPRVADPSRMLATAGTTMGSAFDDLASLGNTMNQKRIDGEMTSVIGNYAGQDMSNPATRELLLGDLSGVQGASLKDVKGASDMLFGRLDAERDYAIAKDRLGVSQGNLNLRGKEFTRGGKKFYKIEDPYTGEETIQYVDKDNVGGGVHKLDSSMLRPEEKKYLKDHPGDIKGMNDNLNPFQTNASGVIGSENGTLAFNDNTIAATNVPVDEVGSESYAQNFMAMAEQDPVDVNGAGAETAALNNAGGPSTLPQNSPAVYTGVKKVSDSMGGVWSAQTTDGTTVFRKADGSFFIPPKLAVQKEYKNSDGSTTQVVINKNTGRDAEGNVVGDKPGITWKSEKKYGPDNSETTINVGHAADGKVYVKDVNGNNVEVQDLTKEIGTKKSKTALELKGAEQSANESLDILQEFGDRVEKTPTAIGSIGSNPGSYAGNQIADKYEFDTDDQRTRQYIKRQTGALAAKLRGAVEAGVMTKDDVDRYITLLGNPDTPYARYMETINEMRQTLYNGVKTKAESMGVKYTAKAPVPFGTDSANNVSNPLTRQGREDIYNDVTERPGATAMGFFESVTPGADASDLNDKSVTNYPKGNATGNLFGSIVQGAGGGRAVAQSTAKSVAKNTARSLNRAGRKLVDDAIPYGNQMGLAGQGYVAEKIGDVAKSPSLSLISDIVGKWSPSAKKTIDGMWVDLLSAVGNNRGVEAKISTIVNKLLEGSNGFTREQLNKIVREEAIKAGRTAGGATKYIGNKVGTTGGAATGALFSGSDDK